jgi:protein-disulfide isomerase
MSIDILASVAMIAAAALLSWQALGGGSAARPTTVARVPSAPLSLDGAPVIGVDTARAVVIEFSDFECPFCARFTTETMPELKTKYIDSGLVKLAFRHLPLPSHSRSMPSAVAADCAGNQGKFWPLHDKLFASPKELDDTALLKSVAGVGVDIAVFQRCLVQTPNQRVSADIQLAKALGIRSTPTFLVGVPLPGNRVQVQTVMSGAKHLDEFVRVLDQAVRSAS